MITRKFALYTTSNEAPLNRFSIGTVLEYKGDNEYPENDPDWCRVSEYVSVNFYQRSEEDAIVEGADNILKKERIEEMKEERKQEAFDHADMLEEIYHD